jgi:prepilin-type N-terminal cleavage/methylation domain-containing protein
MKGISSPTTQPPKEPLLRAFTLAEVMVAMLIFAMSATGLTGLFLQNLAYATWQVQNVHVTNTSFGIADQIKNMGADAIYKAYLAADPKDGTPLTLNVTTVDPTDLVDGYKTIALNINQKDTATTTGTDTTVVSKVTNSVWNNVTLKCGRLSTSTVIPVSYWITLRRNVSAADTTPAFDILELTLVDRWSVGAKQTKTINQIQLTFPAPNCSF